MIVRNAVPLMGIALLILGFWSHWTVGLGVAGGLFLGWVLTKEAGR